MSKPLLDCVILLPSIHFVLKAEQLFKQHRLAHDLVPVPRRISSDCGMALAVAGVELAEARKIMAAASLPAPRFFRRESEGSFTPLESVGSDHP